jgi:hypothetical protein
MPAVDGQDEERPDARILGRTLELVKNAPHVVFFRQL